MAETKQFLDAEGLKLVKNDYNGKIDKKVTAEEGKQLIETTKVTKLDGIEAGAQVNTITDENIETKVSGKGFAKTTDIEEGYVQKQTGKGLSTNDYDANAKQIVDSVSATYATKTENNAKLSKEEAEETYAKKADIAGGVIYKGDVENLTALNALTATAKHGDMYNVKETDMNYVFNGTSWDPYAPMTDLSGKADKTELPEAIPTATIQSILNGTD